MVAFEIRLVMHGASRIETVGFLHHGRNVRTGARFVPHTPADDRRVVAVTHYRAAHPVDERLSPARIVARVAFPPICLEGVALEIAFVHHPESQLISKIEELGVRRVVGGSNRVDVVTLHEEHAFARSLLVEDAALERVILVPVHAAEAEPCAVDEPLVAVDGHGPEPSTGAHPIDVVADHELVELGPIGAPRGDGAHFDGSDVRSVLPRDSDVEFWEFDRHRETRARHPDFEEARAPLVVVFGDDLVVRERSGRPPNECDFTEDAREPPLVLILDVGLGGPLRDADMQDVVASRDEIGHIEFRREA